MESIQFAGRVAPGFGIGNPFPQATYVRAIASPGSKVGAFVGGALMTVVASSVATALFGEGNGPRARLERNWRLLAATTVVGGVVSTMVAP